MTRNDRKQITTSTILAVGFATVAVIGFLFTHTSPLVGLIHLGVAAIFATSAIRRAASHRVTKGQAA